MADKVLLLLEIPFNDKEFFFDNPKGNAETSTSPQYHRPPYHHHHTVPKV